MSEENKEDGVNDGDKSPEGKAETSTVDVSSKEFQDALAAKVEESLKDIKTKLDAAYSSRDELARKVEEREQADKQAHIKSLEEQGKLKEAYELRISEKDGSIAALNARITTLTRDVEVRDALSGFAFRNDIAAELGRRAIVDQLVQKEDGTWAHKSGKSVAEFVNEFASAEAQSFLFKPKTNAGAGTGQPAGTPPASTSSKSLFDLPQSEVLARAARGELGSQNRF